MRCILSPTTDPVFNLAAEEYLFREFSDDLFFLYINTPSVVIGKHQNALAEVDPWFVFENKIPVLRRLSGGGAVYHDTGNLNFSFHKTVENPARINYSDFNQPVIEVLQQSGVPAESNMRNDILVEGKKVSGHAQHVFRNRVLSHGTLLFNANRENLSRALKSIPSLYSGKAIPSVKSETTNIADYLAPGMKIGELQIKLLAYLTQQGKGSQYEFTASDQERIKAIAAQKYSTWEWNFGYSPEYTFQKKRDMENGDSVSVTFRVVKGIIREAHVSGEGALHQNLKNLEKDLPGNRHEMNALAELIPHYISHDEITASVLQCFF